MAIYKKVNPKSLFLGSIIIALFFVLACGSSAIATPAPAATTAPAATAVPTARPAATVAPVAPPTSVNPGKVILMLPGWGNERFDNIHVISANANYMLLMHAKQIAASRDGQMLPGIATKWEVSSDGLTWTFDHDFDGVKFHDGTDMTIEDVLWTYQHNWGKGCLEFCTNTGNQSTVEIVDSIDQTGPNQISVELNLIFSGFAYDRSELPTGPSGIHPKRPLLYDTAQEEAYDKNPIMAGIMKFVEQVPATRLSLERFDDYYYQPANGFPEDRRANFQFLDMLLVPEEATRAAAIQAGQADIAPLSLETRDQVESGGGRLVFGREAAYWRVVFPHMYDDPSLPYNDKRVRRALAHAIDKELLMNKLYGGSEVAEVRGFGPITPGTVGYSDDLDPLAFDPDLARELLADAGYPDGEGFGKVIINTYASAGGGIPFLAESALVAADFWKRELNLDVEVRVGDDTTLNKAWRNRELTGTIFWRDNETRRDAVGTARAYYGRPDFNRALHNDQALFDMVLEAIEVFDLNTRTQALNDLYKVFAEEQYQISIGYTNLPWGAGPRIANWEPFPSNPYPSAIWTMILK